MNNIMVVLDIDGTLIDSDKYEYIAYPRPYLFEFLEFCFLNFKNVSIWTAGSLVWVKDVYFQILRNIIRSINNKHNLHKTFSYIFSNAFCIFDYDNYRYTKPLDNIINHFNGIYNRNNIIMIDDTRQIFTNYDLKNLIIIPSYQFKEQQIDNILHKLINYLINLINDYKLRKKIQNIYDDCYDISICL